MVASNIPAPLVTLTLIIISCGSRFDLVSSEKSDRAFENRDFSDSNVSSWYRLPENVLPINYELSLYPRLAVNNFTYEGRVSIELRVMNETDSLIVHVVGLKIDPALTEVVAIVDEINVKLPIYKQEVDTDRQIYVVTLIDKLPPARYVLSLSFVGDVLDDVFGFYRSTYEADGKTRWLGVTQFSPIFARRAFPCLDEPYLKATYRLRIGHYANETVTGNTMPEMTREIEPEYFLTTFQRTPVTSTYLIGWSIHNFDYTEASNTSGFGLWSRQGMRNHSCLVLNEFTKIYDSLGKWINFENPIRKMEHVAVPDFYFSAMENWGMVTFRESVVLWENGVTPTSTMHNGLSTIGHEYAHTWFGNLVTPKFWNVAWLKEGFATFFGHYGLHIVHPERRIMDLFGIEVLQHALLQDSVRHNRTMNGEGSGRAKLIPGSMDFVTYKKASSIIRMVYHLIGDQAFRRGLQSYVRKLAYKYAIPNDFYKHLQYFADKEDLLEKPIQLRDVVESWANQPGYPVVTVTRNYLTNLSKVSQEKFYLNRSRRFDDTDEPRWWIPVNFATAEYDNQPIEKYPTFWVRPREKSIFIPTVDSNETVICNVHQAYYYRVNYDTTNWNRLINHMKSMKFRTVGSSNRASLLDDSFNLARAGYVDYSIPLELSRYLTREYDYEPWVAATKSFDFLAGMLNGSPSVKKAFQTHVNRVIQPIYGNLTFYENSTDSWRTKLLRNLILSTACAMNNEDCLNEANSLFTEWLNNPEKRINPDAKRSVYCAGIRLANHQVWHRVLQIFLETELHTEQELLIAGLGCTNNSTLVSEFLNYSLYDGPKVRKQYRLTILDAVLNGNPENVERALNFVDENLEKIIVTRDTSFLEKMFEAIKKWIVLEGQLRKFTSLVEKNAELLGASLEDARKAIEFAKENISWIQIYAPRIATWLT